MDIDTHFPHQTIAAPTPCRWLQFGVWAVWTIVATVDACADDGVEPWERSVGLDLVDLDAGFEKHSE